jgi:hypothetical protein
VIEKLVVIVLDLLPLAMRQSGATPQQIEAAIEATRGVKAPLVELVRTSLAAGDLPGWQEPPP